ncbi:MAG: hypothetical protein LBK61_05475 [Spirochaetaceae bacterium]|nr:hypothetical protein [Spirochaetaceae bacterium]
MNSGSWKRDLADGTDSFFERYADLRAGYDGPLITLIMVARNFAGGAGLRETGA